MGTLTFRGVSTASLDNVIVAQMPSHKKAKMRYTEYYVKGRDGAVHVNEGLANFPIQAKLILLNAGAKARQLVNAWADGTGKLVTSDDPTLAYMATIKDEIVWTRQQAAAYIPEFSATKAYSAGDFVKHTGSIYEFLVNHAAGAWNGSEVAARTYLVKGLFDVAAITFDCQPYMYEATDSVVVLTASGSIVNPGTAEALPLVEVNGSGDVSFSIAGKSISIAGMTANVPVYIDSETGYIYTATGAATITGECPVIPIATPAAPACAVTLGTGITSLRITPRWRWI